jgi:hypothetical protein
MDEETAALLRALALSDMTARPPARDKGRPCRLTGNAIRHGSFYGRRLSSEKGRIRMWTGRVLWWGAQGGAFRPSFVLPTLPLAERRIGLLSHRNPVPAVVAELVDALA